MFCGIFRSVKGVYVLVSESASEHDRSSGFISAEHAGMCFRAIGFNKSREQVGSSYWSRWLWSTCLRVWGINVSRAPSPAPELLDISPPMDSSGSRMVIYHGKRGRGKDIFTSPDPVKQLELYLWKLWFLQTSASLRQLNLDCACISLMAPWPVKYDMRWNHQEYKTSGELLHACVYGRLFCMYICVCTCVCTFLFMSVV